MPSTYLGLSLQCIVSTCDVLMPSTMYCINMWCIDDAFNLPCSLPPMYRINMWCIDTFDLPCSLLPIIHQTPYIIHAFDWPCSRPPIMHHTPYIIHAFDWPWSLPPMLVLSLRQPLVCDRMTISLSDRISYRSLRQPWEVTYIYIRGLVLVCERWNVRPDFVSPTSLGETTWMRKTSLGETTLLERNIIRGNDITENKHY